MRSLGWRIGVTVAVTLLAILYVVPTVFGDRSPLGNFLKEKKINLGLDLKGGVHLTLGVDIDKAVDSSLVQAGEDLRGMAKDEGIVLLSPRLLGKNSLEMVLVKAELQKDLDTLISRSFSNLEVKSRQGLDGGKVRYSLSLNAQYRSYLSDLTLEQAVRTIRRRLDPDGVKEPDIRKQKDVFRIQVQLPGMYDPGETVKLINTTGHLEFKIVDDDVSPEKAAAGILPPGEEVLEILHRNPDGTYLKKPIVVKKEVMLTGEYVSDAKVSFDSANQSYIALTFNSRGGRLFERVTSESVGKKLAIILDGKVYSAPVIQERISGGRASITGQFTMEEAKSLAVVIREGALPAPVHVLEERTVGPSLGQESIDQGVNAAILGGALVVLFMLVYYGVSGLVADLMLVLDLLFIMALLAGFGATLTLPGIAGIILTLGMAVDANVLIYERVREELSRGQTVRGALDVGFSRASLTIFDSNLTTLIATAILYQFGTGPVRGFAVTLSLGIVASMFTAIFVSRIVFDWWVGRKPSATLSI